MKNHDKTNAQAEQFRQAVTSAVASGDTDAVVAAFTQFAQGIEQSILADAAELMNVTDSAVLAQRGVRQLTGEERKYYNALIDAMSSSVPKQALSSADLIIPKTTIDAVFDDLTQSHPLLDAVNFQNTSGMVEFLVNTGTAQLAKWGTLTAEIVKELTGGFKKVGPQLEKITALLPVSKSMLDLGPEWLDRYVRTILQEAIYLGVEEGIINGTGKDEPIGMNRQVGQGVSVLDGVYPEKDPVKLLSLSAASYGALLANLTTNPNGISRVVESVVMIVNPKDYLTKIMPATTVRTADGSYNRNVFPFPTTIIQSIRVPEDRAIVGIGKRYFMGVGTAKSGKIEYSDEYHFLEDERIYLAKLYGHGEPLDNNAFIYVDISELTPAVPAITVQGTVNTKEQAG